MNCASARLSTVTPRPGPVGTSMVLSGFKREALVGDVIRVVTLGGRDVAGQDEAGQAGQRQVARAADPRLQHPAAPDRHPGRPAQVMDRHRLAQPADAPGLDVDHPARGHLQRLPRVPRREDALIQADRRAEFGLQQAVIPQIVLIERLFDQQQAQVVQRAQCGGGFQRVSRVRIDLQTDVREGAPHGLRITDVPAGFDLDLDAAVALRQVTLDDLHQRVRGGLQTDRNTDGYTTAHASK